MSMSKETLALILVMGVAGLVILAFVLNDAYGVHEPSGFLEIQKTCIERTTYTQHYTSSMDPDFKYDRTDSNFEWCIQGLLMDILEEEKKQTALLAHIDCMQYWHDDWYNVEELRTHCGSPLNITGVWKP